MTNTSHLSNYHPPTKNYLLMKKELWQKILQFAITVLTAIATTFGVTSCMDSYCFFSSKPISMPSNCSANLLMVEADEFSFDATPVMVFTTESSLSAS